MMNKWEEMRNAFREAEATVHSADAVIEDMAIMLVGRLKQIKSYSGEDALASLKTELRDFNIQTKRWKP